MEPVVTPEEMAAIDAAAPEPVSELIERAGFATALAAIEMLDNAPYGKRVLVYVGKGNNGADGVSAARYLERRGARCSIVAIGSDAVENTPPTHRFDLVIDACFGTGLGRDFDAEQLPIDIGTTPVLAVDIPSGVDGLTGIARGTPIKATKTVTFASLKPGLLFEPGRSFAGRIQVADIGLDCGRATISHLDRSDISTLWPLRGADHHKWRNAVLVIGGSPGMTGAPSLTATAALRAGAGYVLHAVPGTASRQSLPTTPVEAVAIPTPFDWVTTALGRSERCGAVVIGPGLPVEEPHIEAYLANATTPTVFDAGAFDALGALAERSAGALFDPDGPLHVLTPHDGEFQRLTGEPPGENRIAAARTASVDLGAVVLLKGPTTVVANPHGRVLISTAGDQRLGTAGTGDVLAGIIAAGISGGLDPFLAAGVGAELHGTGGLSGYRVGMTSGDLPSLVAAVLSE